MGRVTIKDLINFKGENKKISMLTAYDYYSASLAEKAGIDVILVGDSLGMVVQGKEDTLSVELEDMIYHTKMVKQGTAKPLIVTDLPFMTYQEGVSQAMKNAGRIIKKAGAGAVKLEGGKRVVPQVKALVQAGIPVMGHLGLTPQSVHQLGGYKVQAKSKEKAVELIEDALELQDAGVFSLVLETVPMELAKIITEILSIPTIGIGAGIYCNGQVLVYHDLLGYDEDFKPRFARQYAELNKVITDAISKYISDLKQKKFPDDEESFHIKDDVLQVVKKELDINEDI
ncbi:MAG: 3-methyl-2-oxobutanoate hydroxymethyltransferase [Halothermotrichaceae bacterium]